MVIERQDGDIVYLRGNGIQPYIYVASQSPDHKRHFQGATWVVATVRDPEAAAALPTADRSGPRTARGLVGERRLRQPTVMDSLSISSTVNLQKRCKSK